MNTSDSDYIDVNTINTRKGDWLETVAKHVHDTVKRFGNQEFTARHVYGVLFANPVYSQEKGLYDSIKSALKYMIETKRIEIITQGEFKRNAPTIYRAIKKKESSGAS